MITPLNLDSPVEDAGFRILIHGDRGVGKTRTAGDFLQYEAQYGKVAYVNTVGEGFDALRGSGLGSVCYPIADLKQFKEFEQEARKTPYHAIALDSINLLSRMVKLHVVGTTERSPMGKAPGDKNEWVEIQREFENAVRGIALGCKYLFVTCPSDTTENQLTHVRYITPDLIGKMSLGVAGMFEWVGYLKAMTKGKGKVERKVQFYVDGTTLTRQQARQAITEDIVLPDGDGAWKVIKKAIVEAKGGTFNS